MEKDKTLMTEGCIWKIFVRFAFPIFLGNLFQQMYNTMDSLIVGNFCGNDALAAVSSSGSLCYLLIGFFQGVFIGASVLISNRYGARDEEAVDRVVHTTVVFSVIMGVILTVLGVGLTPMILRLMGTPENVLPNSITYFRIYCSGLLAMVLYNTANGIFQALGDSKHPLYYLIISSIANIILDIIFVVGFDMGVAGAALATVLGQILSVVLAFAHLMSGKFIVRISLRKLCFDRRLLSQIFRMGFPSGIQNSVIAIANVVVQSNINTFGNIAMAGCGSYSKIEGFVFLPVTSLTLAITTFIGQNLGAEKVDRVKKGAKTGVFMTVVTAELVGVLFFIFAPYLIGLFSSDPEVIAYGVKQARVETLFFGIVGLSHGAAAVFRGAGKPIISMTVLLSVWCVFRIIYITVFVSFVPNIAVVFSAYPVTWSISSIIFLILLSKGDWYKIDLRKGIVS